MMMIVLQQRQVLMIGKIYKALTPFYDQSSCKMSHKARPALVLARADNDDYIILPVSSISNPLNIDPVYDIEVDPVSYPKLHLLKTSYIRTHKQTVIHRANLSNEIGDLKSEYEDLYLVILEKREAFSNSITSQAL